MENKPVAWIVYDEFGDFMLEATPEGDYDWIPLYTAPRELSDEEIRAVIDGTWWVGTEEEIRFKIAKAVLKKASEK
jgi:hypothetical protein